MSSCLTCLCSILKAFYSAGIFDATDIDPYELEYVLLYHVFDGYIPGSTLSDGLVRPLSNENMLVDVDQHGFALFTGSTTANVDQFDIQATNGLIHVIDNVLFPPPDCVTLVESNTRLKRLTAALGRTGLVPTLQNATDLTVFAPTDSVSSQSAIFDWIQDNIPPDLMFLLRDDAIN